MALILQIETATSTCSVAVSLNGRLLALKEETDRNIHAANLTLFIEEVMEKADKKLDQLDAVAVSKGPGSYTGLRIGVSTAKGLCYALDIPLISIHTLRSMAWLLTEKYDAGTLFCPMIDARRMEVYTAVYDHELQEIEPVKAVILGQDSFRPYFENKKIVFFGDGSDKFSNVPNHPHAVFEPGFHNSAAGMTILAYNKFLSGSFEDTAYFEPYYLKEFIALQSKSPA